MSLLTAIKSLIPSTRAGQRGDWDTAGGNTHSGGASVAQFMAAAETPFRAGLWEQARQTPAHPGRVGGGITPRGLVVHTTDTYPGAFKTIVKSWTSASGKGNAAHFMIGRTPEEGVVQFVSIFKNGNHAGGPNHGYVRLSDGSLLHPNLCYVGVELDCAGALRGKGGKFYHPDTSKVIPTEDVAIDEKGRPWHKVTDYQITALKALWHDLYPITKPFPPGSSFILDASYQSQGVEWAKPRYVNLVGHASLNPIQKTDPGPQVMTWMKS